MEERHWFYYQANKDKRGVTTLKSEKWSPWLVGWPFGLGALPIVTSTAIAEMASDYHLIL
jgi:hypothetical protein